ncbi:MAG: thermosome subunit [Candidatus Asgardarchaeum californiense]|nr:MAG: thermosome subunit [Candidatus Asgardarchaeum californiense]
MSLMGTPILILKEGTQRTTGADARKNNIAAARAIAEAIRTALGPRGMDKMLVDNIGDVVITNDGKTILDEIEVQHPAAKMMVQVAKAQDNIAGDGTTSAVVLAGELLKKADELITQKIHPTIVINGFRKAYDEALKILDEIAIPLTIKEREKLEYIAMTSMNSKIVGGDREKLAKMAVDAVLQILEERDGKYVADIDKVQVIKKAGASISDSQYIAGVIIDKEVVHADMPKLIRDAKIALLDTPFEIEKTEFDAEIRITDPTQITAFKEKEENILREMIEKISNVGANVVFCQKGIDDRAQHFLAKKGILAVRRVKKSDMEKLARATGGRIVTNLDSLTSGDLGHAEAVEERKIANDKMVFVTGCKDPKSVSVLLRGGTERIVDEAERAFHDALCVVRNAVEDGYFVAGGGAPEVEVARRLLEFSQKFAGKEQLAIKAFAEALLVIPKTLAENAGIDTVEILGKLMAEHEKGKVWAGVDIYNEKVADMLKLNILEPLRTKKQAIKSAYEAASMIIRIDDVIAAKRETPKPPSGGPGGEGGEYGAPPM